MSERSELIDRMRRAARAIYLATDAAVADDISAMLTAAANLLESDVERKQEPVSDARAAEVIEYIEYTLSLPLFQNMISDYGKGTVDTLRDVRKLLQNGLHPDTRAALVAARAVTNGDNQ